MTVLNKREREVLLGLAEGLSRHEIADVMRLSVRTYDYYLRTAIKKLGATNGYHALALWLRKPGASSV